MVTVSRVNIRKLVMIFNGSADVVGSCPHGCLLSVSLVKYGGVEG